MTLDEIHSASLRISDQLTKLNDELQKLQNSQSHIQGLISSLTIVQKMFNEILDQNLPI